MAPFFFVPYNHDLVYTVYKKAYEMHSTKQHASLP